MIVENKYFQNYIKSSDKDNFIELMKHVEGESDFLDFKEQWPDKIDLVKHILAFANSGGGCLVIGVQEIKENKKFNFVGLNQQDIQKYSDEASIGNMYEPYLPNTLMSNIKVNVHNFEDSINADFKDKVFIVLLIGCVSKDLPYMSSKESGDKLKKNRIYIRRNTKSVEANSSEIEDILNRKVSDLINQSKELNLETHLLHLRTLYKNISPSKSSPKGILNLDLSSLFLEKNENPYYPIESFDEFISSMIEKKKKRIEVELDLY